MCICCRIRVIGNDYGVVLPASCLIVEMCFQCVLWSSVASVMFDCGDVFPMCVFVVGLGLLVMVME